LGSERKRGEKALERAQFRQHAGEENPENGLHLRKAGSQRGDRIARAVRGTVIHRDDLVGLFAMLAADRRYTPVEFVNSTLFIVAGNDHRQRNIVPCGHLVQTIHRPLLPLDLDRIEVDWLENK
jgi:hypothetical protein